MKQGKSLSELAVELERQNAAKVDYIADSRRMQFVTDAPADGGDAPLERRSEIDLLDDGGAAEVSGLVVAQFAHRQIADHLGIPWRYYDRMRSVQPGLLDQNVNTWLQSGGDRRMIRTLDGTARAFLSDRYRRLDNFDLATVVLPILSEIPGLEIGSCELTDERMYIKAYTPRVKGEVKVGEEVCAGVFISNSEVGSGRFRVEPFVYTLACTNGMTISKELGAAALSQVHVGRRLRTDEATFRVFRDETLAADDRAFFMAAGDVVRAAVDEVHFRDLLASMRAAAESTPLVNAPAAIEVLAKAESLGEGEASSILTHLAAGGDLSRWGVLSAVTRHAEDVESYTRASELEELGGKILSYSPQQWRALATAEATS